MIDDVEVADDAEFAALETQATVKDKTIALNLEEVFDNNSAECFEEYEKATGMNQRKPLSEKEIQTYRHMIDWTAEWSYIKFARAIEAAHGIKGEA